jgi:lipopolysaccharide transport system ATP-binding protein
MTEPIITVKNIGKKYNIAHQQGRYISLRDVLTNIIKKPFSFVKVKAKRAVGLEKKEEFWALRDINFEVKRGEVIGVIGKNGAGKSTLLKILSQITPPTTGEIVINGRVGSLLEVGTGFHPELTGRENIFLNGAILGMTRKEIAKKFDEIVAFAGVEKFLDTPVKHFSSGMYVRLAFSVAAHMEPDILIVDEVLAVGDAEFQKKCLGKMSEITKKDGRTILFVSHNMGAIQQLCTKTILLEKGSVKRHGATEEVITAYLHMEENKTAEHGSVVFTHDPTKKIQIESMRIVKKNGISDSHVSIRDNFTVEIEIDIKEDIESIFLFVIFFNQDGIRIVDFMESDYDPKAIGLRKAGKYKSVLEVPGFFNIGLYNVMAVIERGPETFDKKDGLTVKIIDDKARIYEIQRRSSIIPTVKWRTNKL